MKKVVLGLMAFALVCTVSAWSLAAEETKEMKGAAGCSMCAFKAEGGCAAAVKIADTVYALKASEKANDATKKLIGSFRGAAKTTEVVVQGVIQERAVIADSVVKVEVKKED